MYEPDFDAAQVQYFLTPQKQIQYQERVRQTNQTKKMKMIQFAKESAKLGDAIMMNNVIKGIKRMDPDFDDSQVRRVYQKFKTSYDYFEPVMSGGGRGG
jgi:hypothetical protein